MACAFLVISLVSALLGFTGIAGAVAGSASLGRYEVAAMPSLIVRSTFRFGPPLESTVETESN